jgi:PAS domain S-box-containing protein
MQSSTLTSVQLNGILGIADDAIISTDAKLRIILYNQGAERIFGWRRDEMLGQPIDVLLPPRYHATHGAMAAGFGKSAGSARQMGERSGICGIRKDGSEFPAEASISKLAADDGMIYTVILRDVSARREHERALELAKERAEAAMLAKSMFLANMSHEIRTPLNAVIGMTSLLLNTEMDDEQRDYAQTIRSSGELLLTIISDILDFSKIEIGRLDTERHPFDLRRCVEESLDLLSPSASEKKLNLAYLMDDSVPATLISDVTRLRQILVNLLSNAIKFTHAGEVLVNVSARQLTEPLYEIAVSVKDTGIGIPAERLPDLFQSFTQVDASTTRKYGGTGLGLTISKRLAEAMGGRMAVQSQPGVGSTFSFTIVAEASGSSLASNVLRENSSSLTGKRVLIVDDNSTNRRILVKQSLLWGMSPSAAVSAVEALDFVRHGQAFDVAVLDMNMPEVDGLQLAAEIRKYRPAQALPLIMLTSVAKRPRELLASELEFAAYLNKPIKPAALFDALLLAMGIAPQGAPTQRPQQQPADKLAQRLPLNILLAEDNTVNQKVIQQLLAHLGYRVDVVGNGVEVLEALERQSYDVVLMDVQMPEMDGLEATARLRRRYPEAGPHVIAMTANAMPGDREKCLAAGMDDYLAKPIDLADLSRALMNLATPQSGAADAALQDEADDVIDQCRIDQLRELEDASSPSLLADLVAMFRADAPLHLDTISAAVAAQAVADVEAGAHRFLSGIETLGLRRMRASCAELERMAVQGNLGGAPAALDELKREYELASRALQRLVQS